MDTMERDIRDVGLDEWVIAQGGKWYRVVQIVHYQGYNKERKPYFYGRDGHGNEHLLNYADCRYAFSHLCLCGDSFETSTKLIHHLDRAWDTDDQEEARRHGIAE